MADARRYAADTEVPAERSRSEVEILLRRAGASAIGSMWSTGQTVIGFELAGRRYRITLRLPSASDEAIRLTAAGKLRNELVIHGELAKEERRRWRALALVIKAKLTAVAEGIETLEHAFLADLVLPDGLTVAEHVAEPIELAYRSGAVVPLLPSPGARP